MKCKICGTRNSNLSAKCKFCGYDMKESVSYNNVSTSDSYSYDNNNLGKKVYTINEDYTKNSNKFYNNSNSNVNPKAIKIFVIIIAIFFLIPFVFSFSIFFFINSFGNRIEESFESMTKFETIGTLSNFENCYYEDGIELCNAVYEYYVDDEMYSYVSNDFLKKEEASDTINIIYNEDNPTQTIVDGSYSVDLEESEFKLFSVFDIISFFIPFIIFIIIIIIIVKKLGKKNSNTIWVFSFNLHIIMYNIIRGDLWKF